MLHGEVLLGLAASGQGNERAGPAGSGGEGMNAVFSPKKGIQLWPDGNLGTIAVRKSAFAQECLCPSGGGSDVTDGA